MKTFSTLNKDGNELEIRISKKRFRNQLLLYLCFIIIYYMFTFLLEGNHLIKIVFYILPFFLIPKLIKLINGIMNGKLITFDKFSNNIYINNKKNEQLDNIDSIQINFNIRSEINECNLSIKFKNNKKLILMEGDAYYDKKNIEKIANTIGLFTGKKIVSRGSNFSI